MGIVNLKEKWKSFLREGQKGMKEGGMESPRDACMVYLPLGRANIDLLRLRMLHAA
jgi:hypothetical protein